MNDYINDVLVMFTREGMIKFILENPNAMCYTVYILYLTKIKRGNHYVTCNTEKLQVFT